MSRVFGDRQGISHWRWHAFAPGLVGALAIFAAAGCVGRAATPTPNAGAISSATAWAIAPATASVAPTSPPTATPTLQLTAAPTSAPTAAPTVAPSKTPTGTPMPTAVATSAPSKLPLSGAFVQTGSMVCGGGGEAPTQLADGRVLFTGGFGCQLKTKYPVMPVTTASAQLYDPADGKFTSTGSMARPRTGHTATLLQDGQVLVAGGGFDEYDPFDTAELYDPATGKFRATGSMTTVREGHTATLLQDGRVLITGGWKMVWTPSEGLETPLASAELYDPQTGKFTATGSMTTAREGQTATLLQDGRVLIAGGDASGDGPTTSELYDPATGLFTPTRSMPALTYIQTATLLNDGRVLVAGGTEAEIFDPTTQAYASVAWVPDACTTHSVALTGTGSVLVLDKCGGDAHLFDPTTGKVSPAAAKVPDEVGPGTATPLSDGRILTCDGPAWPYL